MAKEYMVGTINDAPLQIVELNGVTYFVDNAKGEVFLDEPGLPRVSDAATITDVVAKAKTL